MSCGVVCRHSSDLALLWLWHRPAAVAPIGPLAWEPPYATGAALKEKKKKKEKSSLVVQQVKDWVWSLQWLGARVAAVVWV